MRIFFSILVIGMFFSIQVYASGTEAPIEYTNEENEVLEKDREENNTVSGEMEGYTEEELNATTDALLAELNLDEIDRVVKDMLGDEKLSFAEMVTGLVSGEIVLDAEFLLDILLGIFVDEFSNQKEIMLQLLLLILVSALLMNLSHLFENGQMSNVSFYMVYLMMFVLLMRSFRDLLGLVESILGGASSFMEILSPAYFLAIAAANGSLTASGYYQVVLLVITLVEWFLLKVAIPGIQMYVVLGLVNYLSQEDFLSKMADLIKTVVIWMTKTITALVVGIQVIQQMVSPALDMVKRGVIGKAAGAIPGIGNVLDSVTEMAVGCAVLVRNCMGAVTLIILLVFGLGPVIQLGLTTLLYRLIAAVAQPVSEKRLIKALSVMGEGCTLLLRILITGEILFLLTVAIVAAGGAE